MKRQYATFGVLSLAAATLAGLLSLSPGGTLFFKPYVGDFPPSLALAAVGALGFVFVRPLYVRGWPQLRAGTTARGIRLAAGLATLFAIWQVGADLLVTRFPADINVPAPQSMLFYPAIAYVVEVVFHLVPLALLLLAWEWVPVRRPSNPAVVVWVCILFVAALEPVLVHLRMGSSAYVAIFVFAFSLTELHIFSRFDFVSMYAFRLVFYFWWHIMWGYLRLRWLF